MSSRETLNNLAKGFGIITLGIFLSKVLTYFYRALVARSLGPEAYGELNLALMVLGVVNSFALLSMNSGLKKKIPQAEDVRKRVSYIKSAFHLSIPTALFFSILMFLLSDVIAVQVFEAPGVSILIKAVSIVPVANAISSIGTSTFLGLQEPQDKVLVNQILQNIVQLVATAGFIFLNFGILGAALGWTTGAIITAIISFLILWRKYFPEMFELDGVDTRRRELLRFSAPLMMSGVIATVMGWTDTFFLGIFLEEAEVGFYNAALPIAMMLTIPMSAFGNISLPSLSKEATKGRENVEETLKTLARWTFSFTFPGFIGMALFSEEALKLLFGSEYIVASSALVLLSVGYMINSITAHVGDVLTAYEKTDLVAANTTINLLLNIPLNIILIPQYGVMGAAAATTLSTIIANVLVLSESLYLFNVNPLSLDLLKPVFASVLPLALVYTVTKNAFNIVPVWALVPSALAFGLLYLLSLIVLGGFKDEDKQIIKDFGTKIGYEKEMNRIAEIVCRG